MTASLFSFGVETQEEVLGVGLVKLNGTTVKQLVHVTGSLLAQSAKINSLEVLGDANLSDSTVSGSSRIVGLLRSQNTVFEGPLTICSLRAIFQGSKIASLTVKKDDGYKGKQIVELKKRSSIEGPILFESGKGEVHVYPGSRVFGSVTGGKIVKKAS